MRIKVDEDLPQAVVDLLRRGGHEDLELDQLARTVAVADAGGLRVRRRA